MFRLIAALRNVLLNGQRSRPGHPYPPDMTRVVLLHGAATTARIWDDLLPHLTSYDVVALDRPRTGDLARELAWLASRVEGSWVVGMSGGATLGLALAASGVPLAGAILHEPAVGCLAPTLLTPAAEAFATGGTPAFGAALYGPSWTPDMAGGATDAVTAGELAMFRSFEPGPAPTTPVLVTYGDRSPSVRRLAAEALRDTHGYAIRPLPGTGHFVAHDALDVLAALVHEVVPLI